MFDSHRERLLPVLEVAHDAYYRSAVFGGPSLYFHQRALHAGKDGDFGRFAETVYALLTAWGMHRMGRGGSKMLEFEEFEASIKPLWPVLLILQQASPDTLDENGWRDLEIVFRGIRCMKTGTSLVGNSKVLAHALPNLVAPIDREYTLKFLFGTGNINNDRDKEWLKLSTILREFFFPILRSELFKPKAKEWMAKIGSFKWDTSPLKIVDNLLIGLLRHERGASGGTP